MPLSPLTSCQKIKMNKRNILIAITIICSLGGLYYFGLAATYWHGYLTDTTSTVRHEYMGGVLLALFLAMPFCLLVSAFSFPIRKQISRSIYISLNIPAVILCSGYVLVNIYMVVIVLVSSAT